MDGSHGNACSPAASKDAVRELILKRFGARRVALWCEVGEPTVYQWLSRGTEAEPIPPGQLPAIIAGARREGLVADLAVLWPALAVALEPEPPR